MITKDGKRVVYANNEKKLRLDALQVEAVKSKGKMANSLTKKELEDALLAALKLLEMVDGQGVIR